MIRYVLPWTLAIFVLDQVTKYYVIHHLDLINKGFLVVWDGYITFIMAWNQGVNFGLFAGHGAATRYILIVLALAICAFVLYWMRRETNRYALISAGWLLGGALGNVVDRLVYGAVADFLNVTCCGLRNPWSFNVADIMIFIGAVGLIVFATDHRKV